MCWTPQDSKSVLHTFMFIQDPAQDLPYGHTHIMGEGIGCDPHNGLPQHLGQAVNAFDGQEDLSQGMGSNDVMQKLHSKPVAQVDDLHVALACPWEGGKEEAPGQDVIQVPQSIDECRVPEGHGGCAREFIQPGLQEDPDFHPLRHRSPQRYHSPSLALPASLLDLPALKLTADLELL